MDDQLRPVEKHATEINLLQEVADIVRRAISEYRAECPVAGRLEISRAARKLDRAFHGEAV